jgi:hypothetical protein
MCWIFKTSVSLLGQNLCTTDRYVPIQESSVRMGFMDLNTGLLARSQYAYEGPATAQAKGDHSQILRFFPLLLMQPPRL